MDTAERSLLDHVAHPVFALEPDGTGVPRYAAFNAAACRRLARSGDQVIGLTAAELYSGRLGAIAFDHHVAALVSSAPRTYEIMLPLAEGERLIRTTLTPVLDGRGRAVRLIGTSTDISGSQIFRAMQTEMATLSSEMEDFVSLAAHDLRAPMRHVAQVAAMLREDFEDMGDGKLELIDMLEELGERAMHLIGDVLSHAQAVQAIQTVVEFEFAQLVEEILALLDPRGDCDVTCTAQPLHCDRTAMQISLRNLIENAIKHSEPQQGTGARLALAVTVERSYDGFLRVEVRDNGPGFDDHALRFMNGGGLRTDSGFGLFGVRRLIAARGGTLTAGNAPGGGGIVAFTLPGWIRPAAGAGLPEPATATG